MKRFKNNSLSLVFLLLFFFAMIGQTVTGLKQYNEEVKEHGGREISIGQYLSSGHFIEATFENWESEFLQMGLFIVLSVFLYQKGSSESKDPDGDNETDEEPDPKKKDAPWPVRKGGAILWLYKNSLSIAFFLLFLFSFIGHFFGSMKNYNLQQSLQHKAIENASEYITNSKFWFESFQNWQSEFLSVFSIVILTIYLRQKGSAQSKPVDASNSETGE